MISRTIPIGYAMAPLRATALCLLVSIVVHAAGTASAAPARAAKSPSVRKLVGRDPLELELGRLLPAGRGIVTGHVEGGSPDAYMPTGKPENFPNAQFIARSGASKPAKHARSTASKLYGRHGLALGVTDVHCFSAAHWMRAGCLGMGTTKLPTAGPIRLFNHSWIAKAKLDNAPSVLRRVDYLIDSENVIMVVGVDNHTNRPLPPLLSGAYNVIAVGHWAGRSSGGYTQVEMPGRCKPDLVAPGGTVSGSTPVVAGVVACLLEVADQMCPAARRAESIKAVLLAGADKPPGWTRQPGKPLAEHYGAGRVRLDRSYHILKLGPVEPGQVTSRYGWGFRSVELGTSQTWRFDCPAELGRASIILTWHRRIDGQVVQDPVSGEACWIAQPRLADFDMSLVRVDDAGVRQTVATSAGQLDNVEHIYLERTLPGRYELEVSRRDMLHEAWDFAIAWRIDENRADSP